MKGKQNYSTPEVYIQENGIRYWQHNGKRGLVVKGTDEHVRYFPADYDIFYGNAKDGFLLGAKSVGGASHLPVDCDIDNYSLSEAYSHTELDLLCVDGPIMPLDLCYDRGAKISYDGRSNIDGAIIFKCRYTKYYHGGHHREALAIYRIYPQEGKEYVDAEKGRWIQAATEEKQAYRLYFSGQREKIEPQGLKKTIKTSE